MNPYTCRLILLIFLLSTLFSYTSFSQAAYQLYNYAGLELQDNESNDLYEISDSLSDMVDLFRETEFRVYELVYYLPSDNYIGGFNESLIYVQSVAENSNLPFVILHRGYSKDGELVDYGLTMELDTVGLPCLSGDNLYILIESEFQGRVGIDKYTFEGSIGFLGWLHDYLKNGFCCSEYLVSQRGSRSGSCDLNLSLINASVSELALDSLFNEFILFVKPRLEAMLGCGTSSEKGIMPKCYWESQFVAPWERYTNIDKAFHSGAIDGFYVKVKETIDLISLLEGLDVGINNLISAYTIYYLRCERDGLLFNSLKPAEQFIVLSQLVSPGTAWLMTEAKNIWIEDFEPLLGPYMLPGINGWISGSEEECAIYEKIRNTIDGIYEAIIEIDSETWINLYNNLASSLNSVLYKVSGFDNIERYYQGYYGICVGFELIFSLFVPENSVKLGSYADNIVNAIDDDIGYAVKHLDNMVEPYVDDFIKRNPNTFAPNTETYRYWLKEDFKGNYEGLVQVLKKDGWDKAYETLIDYPIFRKNVRYLDNTSDYLARTGKSKQQLLDDLDSYPGPKESFFDELKDTPSGGTYENFPTGAWNENPFIRGNALEDIATVPGVPNQLQTPRTFPVYDYYDQTNRVATSVKSTDLFAESYQDIQRLESLLKGYVDKVADAPSIITREGLTLGDMIYPINERGLHLIFPYDTPLPHQSGILQTIQSYADERGIRFSYELLE